jgi:hypothetical protein
MNQRKRTIGFGEIAAAISFGAMILATVPVCSAFAQKPAAKAASVGEEASPKQIQELMTLLGDPKVRNWLEKESKAQAAAEQAATEESVSQALDGRLAAIREHLAALAGTVPDLPNQFWQGRERVTADLGENGRTKALLLLAFFVGLGAAVEWLFRKATQRARGRLDSLPLETASDRLRVVALRFALRSVWWRPLPSAASAPSSLAIGRHCCARCCSACSSRFSSYGLPMSSATSCWRPITNGSASFRWIR